MGSGSGFNHGLDLSDSPDKTVTTIVIPEDQLHQLMVTAGEVAYD